MSNNPLERGIRQAQDVAVQEKQRLAEAQERHKQLENEFDVVRKGLIDEIYSFFKKTVRRNDVLVMCGNPRIILTRERTNLDKVKADRLPEKHSIVIEEALFKKSMFGLINRKRPASRAYIITVDNSSKEPVIAFNLWHLDQDDGLPYWFCNLRRPGEYGYLSANSVETFLYELGVRYSHIFKDKT